MAIKESSLLAPQGPGLWLYVPRTNPTDPGGQNFPGIQSANNCGGEAGDSLYIGDVQPKTAGGTFTADAAGYWPHLAIYLGNNNLVDPHHVAKGRNGQADQLTAVPGWPWSNNQTEPVIRIDLASVYFRWGFGSVQVEGGAGPGGDQGTLVIPYLWDRPKIMQERAGWGLHTVPPQTHRLTFFTVARGTIINRPRCATTIWTPDDTVINGNVGASIVQFNFNNSSSVPLPLGACNSFTTTADTSLLFFEIVI